MFCIHSQKLLANSPTMLREEEIDLLVIEYNIFTFDNRHQHVCR